MKATGWGIKSIKQVVPYILPATTGKAGDDFSDLNELYGGVVNQWTTELLHVTTEVGGTIAQEKHVGQDGRSASCRSRALDRRTR